MRQKCYLVLSSGHRLEGELIGASRTATGEMVFTTGMVGYSEALTDPSYFGQILAFTYPLIGNYGVPPLPAHMQVENSSGFESNRVHASAVIVNVDSKKAFHWSSQQTLDEWLKSQNTPGIVGIDVRHLVHLIREHAPLYGKIVPANAEEPKEFYDPSAHQILDSVSTQKSYKLGKGKTRIGVVDCGIKWNIMRQFLAAGCELEVVPWRSDLSKTDCDGWLLSNGPGDPSKAEPLIAQVGQLIAEKKPILGICLGHQLLSIAAGAKTKRMPYGHRSHNQPVYQVGTARGYITSQNHGYVVDESTLPADWGVWFRNANDQTCEGIQHKKLCMRSVQFHPEAAGGPRDTGWIIEQFVAEVQ